MKNPARTRARTRNGWCAGRAAALLWLCTAAHAQWVDPTQPPSQWASAINGSALDAPAESSSASVATTSPGLSVLIVGPQRQLAVIDGQILSGSEAEIAGVHYRLSVRGLERQKGEGHEPLSLHPKVQKIHRNAAPAVGLSSQ